MGKIIAVDADLVLAASDKAWWDWMCKVTKCNAKFPKEDKLEYDLSSYFKVFLETYKRDAMDFWRGTTVYDFIDPVEGSVEAILDLYSIGFEIVVVSHVKGNSNKSKYQFIDRYFGKAISGYVATKEKHYINCDYVIDDRISNLNKFKEDTTCIRLETPYTQNEEPSRDIIVFDTWEEIKNFIIVNENKE